MQSTITLDQAAAIAEYVNNHELSVGVGTEEGACSAASINIALGLGLHDECPPCASPVVWRWMISIQDAMPADMRNASEWKQLLPLVAGTGRALEKQRDAVASGWMWSVLGILQDVADAGGFGYEWRKMCADRTQAAAHTAYAAAYAVDAADAAYAASYAASADAARAAARAARAVSDFWAKVNPAACLARMINVTE